MPPSLALSVERNGASSDTTVSILTSYVLYGMRLLTIQRVLQSVRRFRDFCWHRAHFV